MPQASSIQIQTVLYRMDKPSLFRSLDSIANAVRVDRETVRAVDRLRVVHGDASPDPTFDDAEVAQVRERYAPWFDYTYIFFDENTGTSRGHNRMFRDCTADYVQVMNPDIQLCPPFFGRMLEPFTRTDVRAGLAEARQVPIEHPKEYDEATKKTAWSTGACFVCAADVYRAVGGFDEQMFFMYCDDVDLSWRIRLAGYDLIYQPLAPVFHAKYLSADGHWCTTDAEEYYSAEAALFMAHKWSFGKHLNRLLKEYEESGREVFERAARSYRERREAGTLAEPIDPEHRVGDINDRGYASIRFSI